MENFANFIIRYIQQTEIHGVKGWYNQLNAYEWRANSKIEGYPDAISRTQKYWNDSQRILKTANNNKIWNEFCEEIRIWGGMNSIQPEFSSSLKESVYFLLKNNPNINCEFSSIPITGKRITIASKVYYYSDPLNWTIYDSRVGYAIHQLIYEYGTYLEVPPTSLFPNILCLPESKTDKRNEIFKVSKCYGSEKKAKCSFLWSSHLLRIIASKLNETDIEKPQFHVGPVPKWELPHIQMVFFVIGIQNWIEAPAISNQNNFQEQPKQRGDIVGPCPLCGYPVKIRMSRKTGELYEGCTNYPACKYKGNRSH